MERERRIQRMLGVAALTLFTLTSAATGDDCQLRTQTQGGWGAPPNGNNPAVYLHAHFAEAFPNGLVVGCDNSLVLTSAQAVTNYLPGGGQPALLPPGTLTDPVGYQNNLAAQLVAASLSVGLDANDPGFGESDTPLGSAIITTGPFAGMTVNAVLSIANDHLGGCGSVYTSSQLNSVLTSINESFVDGTGNSGFLACPEPCTADAGTLSGYKPTDCLVEGGTWIGGIPNGDAVVPDGYSVLYVLTLGPELVIMQTSNQPVFLVDAIGSYTVHTLVYDPNTLDLSIVEPGVTTGGDVFALLIEGGGSICGSLDVTGTSILVDNPDAGSLTAVDAEPCLEDGSATVAAIANGDIYVPAGYTVLYVLTQGPELVIINAGSEPAFEVSAEGLYTIHSLVYDPNTLDLSGVVFGETTGFDVNALLIQGGGGICAALDVAGAPFTVTICEEGCTADAGSLSGYKSSDCLDEGGTLIGAIPNGDAVVPDGYSLIYVLTQGPELIIIDAIPTPIFNVTNTGFYTIHTLVYDPNTLDLSGVVFGETTGFDINALLIQGGGGICGSLDVVGTSIVIDNPDAGTLEPNAFEICLDGESVTIGASQEDAPYVPQGYSVIYVLTQGPELVIVGAGSEPAFDVTSEGSYTIHTLVYDPNTLDLSGVVFGETTGFDVNALLIQGGGGICGALDVVGAPILVIDCPEDCLADAGTLQGGDFTCLEEGGTVTLTATANGDANVPAGYQTVYVLTQGTELVIINAGAAPNFDVTAAGLYTIHTLVYDPNTLDLTIVEPGVTTGGDVFALLIEGGGEICGSLDVTGAAFEVIECPQVCLADAGTLQGGDFTCLEEGGTVTLVATANGDANVPAGYQTVYVLTQGTELVIINAGAAPSFDVTAAGLYTIHTLVYDPNTLDLTIVEPGVTTGGDVFALLIEGGGEICGSLDVTGAAFEVIECPQLCLADAGGITGFKPTDCLFEGGTVIGAIPNGDAVVPAGFEVLYVLTQGDELVIENAAATPFFTVDATGLYTIHTLVYDPNTLDLSGVVFGETTGGDVFGLLIDGGGSICGSLDVTGTSILIDNPTAGTLTATSSTVCLENGAATISATPNGDAYVPAGYQTLYVLTQGPELVIINAGEDPGFEVTAEGSYTIHTLVYDPATLDLSGIEFGVTTGADVHAMLIDGGGSYCAALDVAGAPVQVNDCDGGGLLVTNIYPNPTSDVLMIELNGGSQRTEIGVFDSRGAWVVSARTLAQGEQRLQLNVSSLEPGQYVLRVVSDEHMTMHRFIVVR